MWWDEADRHGVLPLDDRLAELFTSRFRDNSPHPSDRHYTYRPPMAPLPSQAGAPIGGRSFDMSAAIDPYDAAEGVLYATGTQNSGVSFFVKNEYLMFDYNAFDSHTIARSTGPIPSGATSLSVELRRNDDRSATVRLLIDGTEAGHTNIPWLMGTISSVGASIGYDAGSPVSLEYAGPFPFTGRLRQLDIQLVSRRDQMAREAQMREGLSRQ